MKPVGSKHIIKKVTISKNPDFDLIFGFVGFPEIPTKQDRFKPITDVKCIVLKSGEELPITEENQLYFKKKSDTKLKNTEQFIRQMVRTQIPQECPYPGNIKLEIIIEFPLKKTRSNDVDLDNLIKFLLDALKGLVYDDDNQICSILAIKQSDAIPQNGFFVGIRKIRDFTDSLFKELKLQIVEEVNE